MSLIIKKTTELTSEEIERINTLFNRIFKHDRTEEIFLAQYLNTPMGFSYHVMLMEGDELIGFHSGMPFYYLNNGQRFIAGLGIDTMTAEGHRDFFNVRDMFVACEKAMIEDGCVLRIGFPNDKSYPVLKKGFKYKDIGKLDTVFLPIRIGGIKPVLKILNPLSLFASWSLIQISKLSQDGKIHKFRYEKERESFDKVRYKWFDGQYKTIEINGVIARYKIKKQEGVMTAFLLDVHPLSKKMFDKVVRYIYDKEKNNIDLIMYVGHLPFTPMSLITMPHKFEPKHFNFTCRILEDGYFDDSIYNINNWDVNLSNYDLL